jgi:hypothetical protein
VTCGLTSPPPVEWARILINEPGQVGTIGTNWCTYADQAPYSVAVLRASDRPIEEGFELLEPQLVIMGEQAVIMRGYERLQGIDGAFTVLQVWRCEPA